MKSPEVGRTLWSAADRDELWGRFSTCGGLSIRLPPFGRARPDLRNAGQAGSPRPDAACLWLLLGCLVGQAVPPASPACGRWHTSGVSRKQLDRGAGHRFLWPVGMGLRPAKPHEIAPFVGQAIVPADSLSAGPAASRAACFFDPANADDEKRSSAPPNPWNSPVQLFLGQCTSLVASHKHE